eukprot:3678227-Rhodomonas_salina.2
MGKNLVALSRLDFDGLELVLALASPGLCDHGNVGILRVGEFRLRVRKDRHPASALRDGLLSGADSENLAVYRVRGLAVELGEIAELLSGGRDDERLDHPVGLVLDRDHRGAGSRPQTRHVRPHAGPARTARAAAGTAASAQPGPARPPAEPGVPPHAASSPSRAAAGGSGTAAGAAPAGSGTAAGAAPAGP